MTSDIENKEWLNDYPVLKQVNKNNPFTVPVGYFDELGQRITARIYLEELKNKMPLSGFTVPENYFEDLNSNIQSRVNIEKALPTENTGFTVPENYFEELGSNIQSRIFVEEALKGDTGFTVPENYFEELSSNIQSRVFIEEALSEHTGFTVPENYFEELNSQITSRIFVEEALTNADETLTVPQDYFNKLNQSILNKTVNQVVVKRKEAVIRRMFASTAFKYATAACLAVMIGTGVFLKQFNDPEAVHKRSYLHKELSNVPVDDIQNYLDMNADDTQHTISSDAVSVDDPSLDAALQDYANSTQK
jgi:hypothetical protein